MPVKNNLESTGLESPVNRQAGKPALRPVRILALADSPVVSSNQFVVSTGFGRVDRNILGRWAKCGRTGAPACEGLPPIEIHQWAIHFDGWGYEKSGFQIFPAGGDWNSPRGLSRFLNLLRDGDYTHVWMLMDPDALSAHNFPDELRKVCREKKIRSMLYYPVDGPLERHWLKIVQAVDVAVCYTNYGAEQTKLTLGQGLMPIEVIPHGVDEVFRPLDDVERQTYRNIQFDLRVPGKKDPVTTDFCKQGDFLMLNVNKNEWRKDPLRSLEILKGLRARGIPAKLVMRMAPLSAMGGVALEMAAAQLGLTLGKEWVHMSDISDENLCGLYNAADLYLTTTLGEGWGLGITEALACGCPVAMPHHTSCAEIGSMIDSKDPQPLWLPLEKNYVCGADTRLRRRVEVDGAVNIIASNLVNGRIPRGKAWAGLSWDGIASRMLELLLEP